MISVARAIKPAAVAALAALAFACGGGGTPTQRLQGNLTLLAGNTAGPGNFDATGPAAGFFNPNGLASDSFGNIYVADTGSHTIRKVTPAGVVSTIAGVSGQPGTADGNGASARFNSPAGIAIDASGNLYVADTGNSTIRRISITGEVSTFAGVGSEVGSVDGTGAAARFDAPRALAIDGSGNIYVADSSTNSIRRITTPGAVVTTFASGFNVPSGVATDAAGNVYVADTENHSIRIVTPAGAVSTFAGTGVQGSADLVAASATFTGPAGIAVVGSGASRIVYVADTGNSTIRAIAGGQVSTLAGTAQTFGSTDASGPAASFLFPHALAVDGAGNVYAADTGNHTIRRITSAAGAASTLAGAAPVRGSSDLDGAAASFLGPSGAATDLSGNVYVADKGNRTVRIVSVAGTVSTLPLTGGGFDPQARPEGIAVDLAGNIYVSDVGGAIFKIPPALAGASTRDIITLAGTLGVVGSANGSGASATFNAPAGIATDAAGNIYVADSGNATIRKITPAGDVSTLAGTAGTIGSLDGAGAAAQFAQPTGVATDSAGNVYVVDRANNNVRKITPAGVVTTLAGHSLAPGSANGAGPGATFNRPRGIAVDGAGNVYIADTNNYTIRAITPGGVVSTIAGTPGRRGFSAGAVPATLADPIAIAIGGRAIYIIVNNGVVVAQ
jgi:sugar lactone lactonase YvrE